MLKGCSLGVIVGSLLVAGSYARLNVAWAVAWAVGGLCLGLVLRVLANIGQIVYEWRRDTVGSLARLARDVGRLRREQRPPLAGGTQEPPFGGELSAADPLERDG